MDKELKQLDDRIKKLEKNSITSNNSNSIGSSSSDFLIKTRGKIKIQWGNKFIDLLKDGELNVNSQFIYKTQEVGSKDGIYVIENGEEKQVILLVSGNQIELKNSEGDTYISFLEEQNITSEQKHIALKNIGFLYENLSDLDENGLKNGIVYIESDQKLYIIKNGITSEFNIEIPNPYTKQFVISKTDNSEGALVIKGSGSKNSLMFDTLYMYTTGSSNYIDSKGSLIIRMGDSEKITVNDSQTIFSTPIVSDIFQSKQTSSTSGFKLYQSSNGSTLEVDNLTVRNSANTSSEEFIYPEYWYKENNIITNAEIVNSEESIIQYILTLKYKNKFKVNDTLYMYINIDSNLNLLSLNVDSVNTEELSDNKIIVSINTSPEISGTLTNYIINKIIFLTKSEEEFSILKHSSENIDLLRSINNQVTTRIGNIQELNLKGKDSDQEVLIEGTGIYSDNGCFLKAQYTSNYDLPKNDSSTKFASTEWVYNLIPSGAIIMFNGLQSEIPNGWHICDGTEGTPNLVGKFIKASNISGEIGGETSISLSSDNIPPHIHAIQDISINSSENGEHSHVYNGITFETTTAAVGEDITVVSTINTDKYDTSSTDTHQHSIVINNQNTESTGLGIPLNWEPSYYSLIYIMKL